MAFYGDFLKGKRSATRKQALNETVVNGNLLFFLGFGVYFMIINDILTSFEDPPRYTYKGYHKVS